MYICQEIRHFSLCQCVQVIILNEMVKLFEIVGKASTCCNRWSIGVLILLCTWNSKLPYLLIFLILIEKKWYECVTLHVTLNLNKIFEIWNNLVSAIYVDVDCLRVNDNGSFKDSDVNSSTRALSIKYVIRYCS